MDEIVLWEHTGKLADDMPIEEVNAFFRDYVKKYGRNKWQDQNKSLVKKATITYLEQNKLNEK